MLPVSQNFKLNTIANFCNPIVNINLYDDYWDYGTSNSGAFGTKIGNYCYNDAQEKQYLEIGTVKTMSFLAISGGSITQYVDIGGAQPGTWTSPILCPYYNATWDRLIVNDPWNEDLKNPNLLFYENFESWDRLLKNGWYLDSTLNIDSWMGTLAQGSNGNAWVGPIGTNGYLGSYTAEIHNTIISTGSMHLSGEISFCFSKKIFDTVNPGGFYAYAVGLSNPMIQINPRINGGSTFGYFIIGQQVGTWGTNFGLGTTYGTGLNYFTLNWNCASGSIFWKAWCNSAFLQGTSPGTLGLFSKCRFQGNINAFPSIYTPYFDDLILFGTAIHTTGWAGNFIKTNRAINYFVQTSQDGTTFTNPIYIGTAKVYNLNDKSYALQVDQTAPYARFGFTFSNTTVVGTVGSALLYCTQIKPHAYYKLGNNEIIDISPITITMENNFKVGQVDKQEVTCKLSNSANAYFGKSQLYGDRVSNTDWTKNPIGFNRPFQMNAPLQIMAGFEGTSGTETTGVFSGYIYKDALESNSSILSLTAYDTWGLIGDRPAGTRAGAAGTVSDYIREIMLYNGIQPEKLYIDNITTSFSNILLSNGKQSPLSSSNGGFGDIWERQELKLPYPVVHKINTGFSSNITINNPSCNYISQTTSGEFSAQFIKQGGYTLRNEILGDTGMSELDPRLYPWNPTGAIRHQNGTLTMWMLGLTSNISSNPIYGTFAGLGSKALGVKWKADIIKGNQGWRSYGHTYIGTFPAGVTANLQSNLLNTNPTPIPCFWDNAAGTGYVFAQEGLNIIMYSFDENFNFAAGSTNMGTGALLSACMVPRAFDLAQGTKLYWYLIGQASLGKTYINKYLGTSTYTFQESKYAGSYVWPTLNYSMARGLVYTATDNIINIHGINADGWHSDKIGVFAMNTQHNGITSGSIYINGTLAGGLGITTGTVFFNSKGQVFFNNMYTTTDIFMASYSTQTIKAQGYLGSTTVKSAVQDLSNIAIAFSWFDANGNFHFQNKSKIYPAGFISTDNYRNYDAGMVETPIDSTITLDIGKIRNQIALTGTSGVGRLVYLDATSVDIYGTRAMSDYTNQFISTTADRDTYGSILLNYTTAAKYNVSIKIAAHPELEVGDSLKLWDTTNNKAIDSIIMKTHRLDLMDWTSTLEGESIKRETY